MEGVSKSDTLFLIAGEYLKQGKRSHAISLEHTARTRLSFCDVFLAYAECICFLWSLSFLFLFLFMILFLLVVVVLLLLLLTLALPKESSAPGHKVVSQKRQGTREYAKYAHGTKTRHPKEPGSIKTNVSEKI